MNFFRNISAFTAKYLALIVVVFTALALFFPSYFTFIKPIFINPLLGLIMFGMGLSIKLEDFKLLFKKPKEVIIGVIAQFVVMPFLAFVLVKVFSLPPEIAIGVILVGASPGGTSSNVITYLSKGDVALSVAITSCTTFLAPIMTPFLIYILAGESIQIDMFGMFYSIVQVVIVPIILGAIIHKFFPKFADLMEGVLPLISTIGIVAIIASIVSKNSQNLLSSSFMIVLIVALHNIFGYLLGFLIGKITKQPLAKIKAISIEVGMQNSGLAASLAVTHFALYPLASVPAAIFSVWHNISGGILASIYSRMKD